MNKDEIISKHPSICWNCELSRHIAEANLEKGYVGCALRLIDSPLICGENEITEGKEIAEGWIYSGREPFTESSGTVSGGRMINYQLITKGISKCKQYKEK